MRAAGRRQLKPVVVRAKYERRSLTPLFLKQPDAVLRSKSICSAMTQMFKLPTQPEAERFIKSARRSEYDQLLRSRHLSSKPVSCVEPVRHIAWSLRRYLLRKRAAQLIQKHVREWTRRKQAGQVIGRRWKESRAEKHVRKVKKWLFLVCLWVRLQAQHHLLSKSALTIQCTFRRFLSHDLLPALSPVPPKPITKRKTLIENFKHFVVSSQIEQAVIAFRWNMELTRKRRLLMQGLKQLHSAVATALVRQLGPGLDMIRRNYEECERARRYRMKKERQVQRFMLRDRKTIQSLSHKLALVMISPTPQTTITPEPGLLPRVRALIHSLLSSL